MKIIIKVFFTVILLIFISFTILELSYRNTKKIINESPEFLIKNNFRPLKYIDTNPNLLHGGEIMYYVLFKPNKTMYKITLVYCDNEILIYELIKTNVNKKKRKENK